ncbi:hypothetical protein BGZ93_000235 [Podila epicladia]|nr:hypothetical protein BGZ92_003151 [Podila epicladia]KAG0098393.1 hypothetical protein BGZ93_000235 [Podila epicladia]
MTDDDGELWQPLRIYHDPYRAYVVLYGDNQRLQTEEFCSVLQGSDGHRQGDSQNQANSEIQPSLKDLFETCKYLYQHAKTEVYNWRGNFRQAIANAQYHHSMLVEGIERLDMAGIKTLVDGRSQEQILEELCDLEQQVPDWEYQRTCFRMLCYKRYLLLRQPEFFQIYGDYALRMLFMAKRGYLNDYYEIPPLDTLKILWGCDPNIIGRHINKDTIGSLIDKAINYLQELFQPKWRTGLGLDRDQSAAIRTFLDVQDDHNLEGNLLQPIYTNILTTNRWKG